MMTTRQQIEILEAYERGEEIEGRYMNESWGMCMDGHWNFDKIEYRVKLKPAPKQYMPFTMEEFKPHRDRWLKNVSQNYYVKATQYTSAGLFIGTTPNGETEVLCFIDMLNWYVFDDDGTPCGVEQPE